MNIQLIIIIVAGQAPIVALLIDKFLTENQSDFNHRRHPAFPQISAAAVFLFCKHARLHLAGFFPRPCPQSSANGPLHSLPQRSRRRFP
ncbi:hypothetical protein DFJ73DRAFT_7244 [Zopfochytrium polystomum]|nr:hypothetical protein DFJ73DRAFT_7244 [Zopfochytrium polystomum]